MTLTDNQIEEEIRLGNLSIEREGELHIGPSSVDLHLYPELLMPFRPPDNMVKVSEKETYPDWHHTGTLRIPPGGFVLATTDEVLRLPANMVGYIQGRSSVGRLGLQVENAGFVDAGFEGQITLELKNQAEYYIELEDDMRICQVAFHGHTDIPSVDYSNQGKYQGQSGPTPSKLFEDFE